MGPGISANYDQVTYIFTSGCWKVHSAISKASNERVCLWTIDQQLLKDYIPSDAQQLFLQGYKDCLDKMRKFRHPRILKIIQIQDTLPDLAFSSEPVSSCLTTLIGSLDKTDVSYIGFQILDGLNFLHNEAKMIYLGLSPIAVYLNETLTVKLFDFNWATPCIAPNAPNSLPFPKYEMEPFMPNISYVAPEVVINKQCYPHSDIFSFCCLLYEMLTSKKLRKFRRLVDFDPYVNHASYALNIPDEFSTLLTQCFQASQPTQRPATSSVINYEPFQTIQVKVLRYLDMIITKDPKDKFGFFKGLSKVITDFSPMMTKAKILPILIEECKTDKRFAPVLLGTIFLVSEKFSVTDFTNEVFKNISYLINVTDPPHIAIALLQGIPLLLDKTEKSLHNDCIYPIIFNSIKSTNPFIQKECLKQLPGIVEKLSESAIRTVLLSKLIELATTTTDPNIVSSSLSTISICLPKIDNDSFLLEHFPNCYKAWKKNSTNEVSEAMIKIILALKASNKNIMSRAMQAASSIASSPKCEPYNQKKLCNWMINTLTSFKSTNSLDRPIEKPQEYELLSYGNTKPTIPSNVQMPSSPMPNTSSFDNISTSGSDFNTNNNSFLKNNNNFGSNSGFSSPSGHNSTIFNDLLQQNNSPQFQSFQNNNAPQFQNFQNSNAPQFQNFQPPSYQNSNQYPTRQPRPVQGNGLTLSPPPHSKQSNDDLLNLF